MNPIVIALILTVIEVPVLVKWLEMATALSPVAFQFLYSGLLFEELLRFRLIKGRFSNLRETLLVAAGVLVESLGWAAALGPYGLTQAYLGKYAVLLAALTLEHAIIRLATQGRFDIGAVLDFSAYETVGGSIWLATPNPATLTFMVATSIFEHVQGIREGLGLRP